MSQLGKYALQAVFYAGFMLLAGVLSYRPVYQHLPQDMARIKLSFSHAGKRKEECIRLSPEEIAKLPPHERKPFDCDRERLPVYIELAINDETVIQRLLAPTGLSRDGASTIYEKIDIRAGLHRIHVRLRDSNRESGFDFEQEDTVSLSPGQHFVIDFRQELGGFIFDPV